MNETTLHTLSHHWRGLAVRGVLSVAFGLVAMVWPDVTVGVLVLLFGACAIADGAVSLTAATRPTTPDRRWQAAAGGGAIVLGIVTFVWPSITALALVALIGVWFTITGVEHIAAAIAMPRGTTGRGLLAVAGVVSTLFGIYLIAFPESGAVALVTTIGLCAVVRGVTLIGAAAASRRELQDAPAVVAQVAA